MDDYLKFKKILEYFVAHFNWKRTSDEKGPGYQEYVKPHLDKGDFVHTGLGYNGGSIQKMVEGWDEYTSLPGVKLCINIVPKFGDFLQKTCYLNWIGTGVNVMADFDAKKISGLKLVKYEEESPSWTDYTKTFSFDNLGLFDDKSEITTSLKKFFNDYIQMYKDWKNEKRNKAMQEDLSQLLKLLNLKKNIILQGAPGTGKTYITAALSVALCNPKFSNLADHAAVMQEYRRLHEVEHQVDFCTFHQSMDYEDFVEGLKPVVSKNIEGDSVGIEYKVEDGIFKMIANRALSNMNGSKSNNPNKETENLFNRYCDYLCRRLDEAYINTGKKEYVLYDKSKMRVVGINYKEDRAMSISLAQSLHSSEQRLTKSVILRDYPKYKSGEITSYTDIKPTYSSKSQYHGNAIYYFALFQDMKTFEEEPRIGMVAKVDIPKKNYVLIIDEINRGNVSRIFGELITLLEADKRVGENTVHPITVSLPYSKNFEEEDSDFCVPDNLYIIGTMNTTDRSTGSIDYAIRRRFAFVTMKSSLDVLMNWMTQNNVGEDVKNKAKNLFIEINGKNESDKAFISQYNASDMDLEDLKIGHNYFMAKTLDDLQLKMSYEIIPLIKEYVKDGILNCENPLLDRYFQSWIDLEPYRETLNAE